MAIIGPIPYGKTETIINRTAAAAGTVTEYFHIESDSVLMSLFATTVSGTLDVSVYTLTEEGKELGIINFPTLSSTTSELLLKKAAAAMSRIKVVATYSGATTFEVRARSIGAGESTTRVVGAASLKASQLTVTTTPAALFPVTIVDRDGLIIKNNSTTGVLYIAESAAACLTTLAYPLQVGESIGIGLESGQTVYGRSSTGTIDARMLESGG